MDGGTGALSGFSYFGLAEKDDGNPKPTPMEEIIATKLAGEGSSFGGSIDFYSVYDRLATIYSAAPNESQTKYISAETIVNNDVTKIYVVVEPVKPIEIKKLDQEETASYISEGGKLSKISNMFEERPIQIDLLKNISNAFNKNKIAVFEAGTGVGKSYAYLIPSVLWSLENKEKVVIKDENEKIRLNIYTAQNFIPIKWDNTQIYSAVLIDKFFKENEIISENKVAKESISVKENVEIKNNVKKRTNQLFDMV